jgi:neuronal cell adhesion molecule
MDMPNGTLTFRVPENDDEGIYQCFAKNKHGFATFNPYIVRKSYMKSFKDDSIDVIEAHVGLPFKLECKAPDAYPKPSVYWIIQTFGSGEIETIENARRTVDPEGNLWFTSIQLDDELKKAYYACSATTPKRNEYKLGRRVHLKVIHANNDDDDSSGDRESHEKNHENVLPPIMQYVSHPHIVTLRGQRTELFCIYGGSPNIYVMWKFNGSAINYDKRILEQNFGKSLLIRDTRLNDQGIYTCDVSNGINGNKTSLINVVVLAKPYFISYPKSKSIVENFTSTVEFECEIRGWPEPDIIWTHNGQIINVTSSTEERLSAVKNKLTIKDLIKSDSGNYGCNATNTLGYAYKDFYLDIVKPQKSS